MKNEIKSKLKDEIGKMKSEMKNEIKTETKNEMICEKKFKYVLFDLDGTLTDSEGGIDHCLRKALDSIGIHDVPQSRIKEMIGPPFTVSMKMFYGLEGEIVDKMLKVYRGQYEIDGWSDNIPYDGVLELVKNLHELGFKTATATSKPIRFTQLILDKFGFTPHLDFIGAADVDGGRERKSQVLEYVLEHFGITDKSEVVLVGDRIYDVVGAKEVGIKCIGILWGFGSRKELEDAGADWIMEKPSDVEKFLTND